MSSVTGCTNGVRHLWYRPGLCRLCHFRIQCSADAFLEVRVRKGAALPHGSMLPGAGMRLLTQVQAGMYGLLDMSILRRRAFLKAATVIPCILQYAVCMMSSCKIHPSLGF